jgi:hypothetical protein
MFKKIKEWYSSQSDTVKAFIWIGVLLIIGIIIRWDYIIDHISKGFDFYSTKK